MTKQEILDAKFDSYQYEQYLYDDNTGEHYSINTLTDEQIRDMIQYDKYQQYQSEIYHYKNTYYDQQDAFYYDITDSNGNHYTNVVLEEKDYLNIIEIPYKEKMFRILVLLIVVLVIKELAEHSTSLNIQWENQQSKMHLFKI